MGTLWHHVHRQAPTSPAQAHDERIWWLRWEIGFGSVLERLQVWALVKSLVCRARTSCLVQESGMRRNSTPFVCVVGHGGRPWPPGWLPRARWLVLDSSVHISHSDASYLCAGDPQRATRNFRCRLPSQLESPASERLAFSRSPRAGKIHQTL